MLAGNTNNIIGSSIRNTNVATLMFFGLFPLCAVMALVVGIYHLVRYRSVQHMVEVVLAVWLLVEVGRRVFAVTV